MNCVYLVVKSYLLYSTMVIYDKILETFHDMPLHILPLIEQEYARINMYILKD